MMKKVNKQYCRYCAFCFNGDVYYCNIYSKPLSESAVKRENKCSNFVLSELGDVDTGKRYQPRIEQTEVPCDYIQMSLI